MLGLLRGFPDQIRRGKTIGEQYVPPGTNHTLGLVCISGMGGSGIAGDVVATLAAYELSAPILVNRNYLLPACVGSGSLALISSYSGNTEETISAMQRAVERGALVVGITSGGSVRQALADRGHSYLEIPGGQPPRSALAYLTIPQLYVLSRLGLMPDPGEAVNEAARVCDQCRQRCDLDVPARENQAKQMALALESKLPVVYGTSEATGVAATRWHGQFAENSKVFSMRGAFPEMNHNEIVPFGNDEKLSTAMHVIMLRDSGDFPRNRIRMDVARGMFREAGVEVTTVNSTGHSHLARLFSLMYLADWVSYYLALLRNRDPAEIVNIDYLKDQLSRFE